MELGIGFNSMTSIKETARRDEGTTSEVDRGYHHVFPTLSRSGVDENRVSDHVSFSSKRKSF